MAIESMTGFARCEATTSSGLRIVCEIRSVNGKSLDARLRLPQSFERMELPLRQLVQKHITRGNLQINIATQETDTIAKLAVNEALIASLMQLSEKLEMHHGLAKPSIGELLSIRGVLESASDSEQVDLDAPIAALLEATLLALKQSRADEGKTLLGLMMHHLGRIEELVHAAIGDPSRTVEAIRQRLGAQVKLLMESTQGFDEQRLTTEAALLATKADIREELDRLTGHIEAAKQLLTSDGPVGRKLDFLAQEFNRETNTLCSKSNALTVTKIGLELKAVVDQFREQVQNLE
ncbi:MAG: YicC/YloC family endoribonuclease [Rhizobiaceae bacterium]